MFDDGLECPVRLTPAPERFVFSLGIRLLLMGVAGCILSRLVFWLVKTGAAGSCVKDLAESRSERELAVKERSKAGPGLIVDRLGRFVT